MISEDYFIHIATTVLPKQDYCSNWHLISLCQWWEMEKKGTRILHKGSLWEDCALNPGGEAKELKVKGILLATCFYCVVITERVVTKIVASCLYECPSYKEYSNKFRKGTDIGWRLVNHNGHKGK